MPNLFTPNQLAAVACVWEATARKPGNVHPGAEFADLTYLDFVLSATAIGDSISMGLRNSVGAVVWGSAFQTHHTVNKNTNLGIILLLAPLAAVTPRLPLPDGLRRVLDSLTVEDTKLTYDAIRLANPGGLGDAPEQDVRSEPTVTLLEAMKAGRRPRPDRPPVRQRVRRRVRPRRAGVHRSFSQARQR